MSQKSGPASSILFVLGSFEVRGRYQRSLALVNELSNGAINARVLSASSPPALTEKLGDNSVYVDHYLQVPLVSYVSRYFALRQLKAQKPDLIDIQHFDMSPLGQWLAKQLGIPCVLHVYGLPTEKESISLDLDCCKRVITVSEAIRQQFLQQTSFPPELVEVVQSGVQIPDASTCHAILPPDRAAVVGTAAPLEKSKGMHHFLHAAKVIHQQFPETLFLIAGSGPEEKPLRRLAAELGIKESLTILPNLENFHSVFQAADIFVMPELQQGSRMVLLDAMATGIPVVSTAIDGVAHIVMDGKTGVLAPAGDPQRLAEKISELLQHPDDARQIGENGRKHVAANFQISQMTQSMHSIYTSILGR